MKAIIFGANGQDGFYLSQLLQTHNIELIKVSRSGEFVIGDVAHRQFVESIIQSHQPDYIFHLAANSTTRHTALFENHESISTGTLNILESVRLYSPHSKVFLSGSAMQFENNGLPIDEHTPFEAKSPYAIARIQSVYAGRYFRKMFGLSVYIGYFFNHDSPLRKERHINQQIAQAAKNNLKIEIGDFTVQKEFNFAGDLMEAVWIFVNQPNIFETVIGGGQAYPIEKWIELCFEHFDKDWREFVSINTNFQPEYDILVSNPTLIKSLGWQPNISIDELARLMVK
jgi:GDPmannose 4,6-dehydratase